MISDIESFDGRIAKVRGGAACGKTEAVIRRALHLLSEGTDPGDILIEATSTAAATTLRRRLIDAAPDNLEVSAGAVRITTATDACVTVLGSDAAIAHIGRKPRVLNSAEYKFFLEDLKTLGLPIRRLRKILRRFFERWAHGADESEWLQPGDETLVFEAVRKNLTLLDAMLAEEVPILACRWLQKDAAAKEEASYAYVLCDDFQNLTRAQQQAMCLLAGEQIVVFGNPNEVGVPPEANPNPLGFTEFDARRKGVEVFELGESFIDRDIQAFADALLAEENMDESYAATTATREGDGVTCIKWRTPEEEIDGLTKVIRVRMNEKSDLAPADMCVVVPNKRWARTLERVLKKRGFETSAAGVGYGLPGDPREQWEDTALAAYVRLGLVAHPDDAVLWRCWCGFGNYLTNSDKWLHLVEWASSKNMRALEAIDALASLAEGDEEPFTSAAALASRVREGKELIKKNARRRGFVLLRSVGASNVREFEDAVEKIEGDEGAAELFELISESAEVGSAFPENSRVMRIATYENMAGVNAEIVVMFAAVDGFMPHRDAFEVISTDADREVIMTRDRKFMHSAAAKARKLLVVSYFSKSDLETAEKTKMQVVRVRAEDGKRMARVRPSTFLREAGKACPVTKGGETLLAEVGLT